jgi:hypothetical protein
MKCIVAAKRPASAFVYAGAYLFQGTLIQIDVPFADGRVVSCSSCPEAPEESPSHEDLQIQKF